MKIVIISDPHAHKYRAFNQNGKRLSNVVDAIEEAWDLAAKQAVGMDSRIPKDVYPGLLLIPGDIFNNHQTVSTDVMVELVKLFTRKSAQYENVDVVMISGNHDQSTKNLYNAPAISAVHALAELADNIYCVDNGYYSGDDFHIFGVPYYPEEEDLRKAILDVNGTAKAIQIDGGNKVYLTMHQTVGFDQDLAPDDIDPKDPLLTPFDMVFNGHIHTHSIVSERFINVGTPLHRDAGDIGKDKGILIFDTATDTFERIILDFPQYRRVVEGDPIPEEWENDYIQIEPKQIEVKVEEREIKENFNQHTKSKTDLVSNYVANRVDDKDEKAKKIRKYGEKLLSYAD